MSNLVLQNVSRETMDDLIAYKELVEKWTKGINLVSKGDIAQIWERHIVDSLQVYEVAPQTSHWVDIGSGGGFPGVVVAILAKWDNPHQRITLIDSDQRKCAFLRVVSRELGLNMTVLTNRIEEIAPLGAKVLSARAVGDLNMLLTFANRHLDSGGVAVFPKGASWKKEVAEARKNWSCSIEVIESKTNSDATILKISELMRV